MHRHTPELPLFVDMQRPKQLYEPMPSQGVYAPGSEIGVAFTEALNCELPLTILAKAELVSLRPGSLSRVSQCQKGFETRLEGRQLRVRDGRPALGQFFTAWSGIRTSISI